MLEIIGGGREGVHLEGIGEVLRLSTGRARRIIQVAGA